MYNNAYINPYNQQSNLDRINAQIAELEKMKEQIKQPVQQPTNLTQNFQLSPTNREIIKYASSIDEVEREMIIGETPFFSKDMSVVWIKNAKGEITTYELNEIIPKDEKDMQIELLISQVNELKGMIQNERINANDIKSENATDTSTNDDAVGSTTKTSKSSSVSRVSTSKKK